MQIVSEIAYIRYAKQSVCIIPRNCCRSSIKGFNQKMYIYAQAWSGCLLQLLRDSRLLNWFVVHHPQRLKSSHLDIFSKCILFLFYALVLILSIYLFLSMFILVFLSIYWFSIVLLFGCIPLLLISSPSNLLWLNPYISNHCNTLSSSQSDIRNPSLQFCWQDLASLLVHERSHFSPCQRELSTATDISIHPLLSVLHV